MLDAWGRHLDIQLAGLRSAGTPPSARPAVTRDQFTQMEEAVASPASRTLLGVLAFSVLSLVTLDTGQLPRAQELADTATDLASHGELRDMTQCSLAYAAAGAVHAARGLLEEGRTELEPAVRCIDIGLARLLAARSAGGP